jgi:hypothetical protein
MTMKSPVLLAVLLCVLQAGCATVAHKVAVDDLAMPGKAYVEDRTAPDDYPGFMAAEGNIYSCRYGIHHQSVDEFAPPKKDIFAALLAKAVPGIVDQHVVLRRFDVYFNYRLKALDTAGKAIGGAVGHEISRVGEVNKDVFEFQKLLVDRNPEAVRHPEENQVGCDREHGGEYYASEISGGHSVIVTWVKFEVDGHPIHVRTYYQFQPSPGMELPAGIRDAMGMTLQAVAPLVQEEIADGGTPH